MATVACDVSSTKIKGGYTSIALRGAWLEEKTFLIDCLNVVLDYRYRFNCHFQANAVEVDTSAVVEGVKEIIHRWGFGSLGRHAPAIVVLGHAEDLGHGRWWLLSLWCTEAEAVEADVLSRFRLRCVDFRQLRTARMLRSRLASARGWGPAAFAGGHL